MLIEFFDMLYLKNTTVYKMLRTTTPRQRMYIEYFVNFPPLPLYTPQRQAHCAVRGEGNHRAVIGGQVEADRRGDCGHQEEADRRAQQVSISVLCVVCEVCCVV